MAVSRLKKKTVFQYLIHRLCYLEFIYMASAWESRWIRSWYRCSSCWY